METASPTSSNNMRCGSRWNFPRRRWLKRMKSRHMGDERGRRRWAAQVLGLVRHGAQRGRYRRAAAVRVHVGGGAGPGACYTFSLLATKFTNNLLFLPILMEVNIYTRFVKIYIRTANSLVASR
ncbi:hypothetical protein D1007_61599 [Hordeum vulgare]|nr:hypothetical protein D1007_61599 [Hordeum vulgare]